MQGPLFSGRMLAGPTVLFMLAASVALVLSVGCANLEEAIDYDREPGVFVKGDMRRITTGGVKEWMLLSQDPEDILVSAGFGTLWRRDAMGNMMVIGGKAHVKTTVQESDLVFADAKDLVRTPFSVGIARDHAQVLKKGVTQYPDAVAFEKFLQEHAADQAVLAVVYFDHVE